MSVNLTTDIGIGIRLANPVMNASGTINLGHREVLDFSRLGATVTKGVTKEARPGNPLPRLAEVEGGLINSIGLENSGIDLFLAEELPQWLQAGTPVIVNISGNKVDDYAELASRLNGSGIAAIEINVSCPNQRQGGMFFGVRAETTYDVVLAVKRETHLPLITKLTPNVTNIKAIAEAAEEAGSAAISAVNTFTALDLDIATGKPRLGQGFGGMSGPAILPQALYKVWQICQDVKIPVIGMGGITCARDAIKFLLVGASAVAVGTANFGNPTVMLEVIGGIERFLVEKGCQSLQEIIGTAKIQ